MQLSPEHILQFQKLYKQEFGDDISFEEASRQGTQLLQLAKLVYVPMTQAEFANTCNFIKKYQSNCLQE